MPLNDKAQKMVDKLETEKEQIKHSTEEMSAELKRLLESEINAFQKREKHRSTEMIAIFARHNFASDDPGRSWANLCKDRPDHVQPG